MVKKILVVDDSLFTRNVMKDIILSMGVDVVITAEGGREALQKYEEEQPDLIFMDIMMPDINGIDIMKEILRRNNKAKVVIFSSALQNEIIKEVLNIGAVDFMPKPIKKEDVLSMINKHL